jgi:DNA-binding IclR family transcriptional regulator
MTANADYERVISRLKREDNYPLRASEIARWEGMSPGRARRALLRLQSEGRVIQNAGGYWALTPNGRSEP